MSAEALAAMRIDDRPLPGRAPDSPLDTRELTGDWLNTDRGTSGGVARLLVEPADGDDRLLVRGFGAGDRVLDWGAVTAQAYAYGVGGGKAFGFLCTFDFGFMRTDVSAYGKEGILIIVTYNRFADDSGRADYWTREFFHRETERVASERSDAVDATAALTRSRDRFDSGAEVARPLDLEPLRGRWEIFKPGGTGLTRVDVDESPAGVEARVLGSGDGELPDWGTAPADVFAGGVGGGEVWGFRCGYDLGFQCVELHGYLNRGLLAIDHATSFTDDSGRSGYYSRVFFYRP